MYHVTLHGQGYLVDLDKYVRRAFEPFAPKRASGARSYGDLRGVEQVLSISDWSGGEGALEHDESAPSRWRAGSGLDGYSEPGSVRLGPGTSAPLVSAAAHEISALAQFHGHLVLGGGPGGYLWRYDGTTMTFVGSVGAGTIRCLEPFQNKLYASVDNGGAVAELTTGWALTPTKFAVAGSAGIFAMRTFYRQAAKYLYLAATSVGTGGTAAVLWWDGVGVSPIQYDFEQALGLTMEVLGNRLYFFVSNTPGELGIYSVDDSGSSGVYRHHVTLKGVYAWDSAVFDGQVYLACSPGGQIYAWDGSVPRRVRQLATASAPYPWELRGIAQFNQALWVAYQDATGLGLLRYDGASWSRPVAGLAGDAPRDLAAYGGDLYLGAYRSGLATAYRVSFGAVRTSGSLDSGLFDADLPAVTKVLRSATVVHGALAAGQSVQVLYRREDAGAWVSLGTSSAAGATSATFAFPAATTFKQAAFRLVLVGPGTSSPVAYELLVRYAVQPTTLREWELTVVLEGTPVLPLARLDGSPEPLTGAQLSAALWSARGANGPVQFVDLDGTSRAVWFEDLREEVAPLSQRTGYQTVARVRLVEAA